MEPLSWMSPTFHFTLSLSSLLFGLPPHGTGEGEGAEGAGNRSAESLDSADHQQLRDDADRKEMRNRGGRQADAGSLSPTPLGSCLVPCCGPGAAARCRNGVRASCGEQGPHSWILCPLESFVCETDHRKGLCDSWDWEIGLPSRQIGKQFCESLENCLFCLGSWGVESVLQTRLESKLSRLFLRYTLGW